MIEKTHRLGETDAGSVSPGDCCPAGAMEPDVRKLRFLAEESGPITAALEQFLRGQTPGNAVTSGDQLLEERNQARAQSRLIDGAAFATYNNCGRGLRVEIYVFLKVDPGFTESAALRHGNVETYTHPFPARLEALQDDLFLFDLDFVNVTQGLAAEPEAQAGVCGGELPANRFIHDDSKNFDIRGYGSWRDCLFVFFLFAAPRFASQGDELDNGVVIEPRRELDPEFVQDRLYRSPSCKIAMLGLFGIGIVRLNPGSDPDLPFVFVSRSAGLLLLKSAFRAELARGTCVFRAIPAEPGCLSAALSGFRVAEADLPVLRKFLLFQRGHADTYGHNLPKQGKACLGDARLSKVSATCGSGSWVRIPPPPPAHLRE